MRRVAMAATLLTSAILLGGCGNGTVIGSGSATPAPPITPKVANEFAIGSGTTAPTGIARGTDGFLYITENATSKIAKTTTAGSVTEYATTTANAQPAGIVLGTNNELWFAETAANKIATITTSGAITEYPVTTANSGPTYVANGPDGNLWFSETTAHKVGVMKTDGTMIAEYALPGAPNGLVDGPDGAMWIALGDTSSIVRVTTGGTVSAPIATTTAAANPQSIVLGPDGALWFTEKSAGKLGRITTAGSVSEFPLGAGVAPTGLLVAVDNNFYFGDANGHVGQFLIGTSKVTLFNATAGVGNLTLGPDSEIYFTEPAANKAGQFLYF